MSEKPVREVVEFLDQCSEVIGLQAKESFHQNIFCEYSDLNITSPIEQFFYTALCTLMKLSYVPGHDADILNGEPVAFGLRVQPQFTIERYRVDFYLVWYGYLHQLKQPSKKVLVECDSQEWHERSEKERRYEKKRDRDLMRLGYQVFRFTGKEILEDPFRVALEVLNHVTGEDHADGLLYLEEWKEARGV